MRKSEREQGKGARVGVGERERGEERREKARREKARREGRREGLRLIFHAKRVSAHIFMQSVRRHKA